MTWAYISKLNEKRFQRRTGVKRPTFEKMIEVVKDSKKTNRGRPPLLGVEDEILLMLSYYREYRTMENTGIDWGLSEAQTCRIINKIENILTKNKLFQLPPKKEIQESQFEIVLVDVTESPIQRPKKNKTLGTLVNTKNTPTKPKLGK
jgi:hypothetical protein